MAKSDLNGVDREIAEFYAPLVLGSLKYGENRICVWFPGAGKSTVLNDIIKSKKILKNTLKNQFKNFSFFYIPGYNSEKILKIDYEVEIESGKEVVLVIDEVDHLQSTQLSKLLTLILSKAKINQRRIHTIINTCDKEKLDKIIVSNKYLFALVNQIEYINPISGKLLEKYIQEKALDFGHKLSTIEVEKIKKKTGGILFLTKEILRSYPNEGNLDAKLKTIWDRLPNSRKVNIVNLKLSIFKEKIHIIESNPKELIRRKLNYRDQKVYNHITKNSGALVTKDEIAALVWDKIQQDDYSDWAIDQVISRLKKKLVTCNIDPTNLKTVKGKGYIWKQ